ncbi:cholesterol 24-hydroxylase-like [Phycodurus eques]|uniref:cholesterol 24-hydroxylase-like n=1 Tax=Phycodurus eques TaxID=693459 RepID=UPI002ACD6C98|nr:cholesterol 24-hydroxylase-like [Phycodurus eques]XP_061560139.1 cholesterol 24-hydroxylase-like [Phycodurus eques]
MSLLSLVFTLSAHVLGSLLFVLFVAFLGYCAYLQYVHLKYDHIPGPPRESFFFGHSLIVWRTMKNDDLTHDVFLKWAERYGSVYKINVLHHVLIFVSSPETIKEVLMSSKYTKDMFLHKRLFSMFGQRFLGNGLVTARDYDQWHKQRRIIEPAFSSLYLRSLMGTFNEQAEKLMTKLADIADKKSEARMLELVNRVTLGVIVKVAFGMDIELLENASSPFPDAIETCLKGMVHNIRNALFQFDPRNWAFVEEVRAACKLLRSTGAEWIRDRKSAVQSGGDVPKDILTQIIKSAGKEERMTKEDEEFMLDNFVTFFIAGQETTANQLAFCIMELARHPDMQEKAQKEVDDVIGMKREISYDDLGQLVYLSQVLKETLRIYPTAPGTSRDFVDDIVIDDIHVPAGAICILSSYVSSRLERFFKNPLEFNPDRFHPDAPKPYYCYFPFSLGPRSCVGKNFAQMEAKLVMAKLLQRFDFALTPGQSFEIRDVGTLRPKGGVVCAVAHRKHCGP